MCVNPPLVFRSLCGYDPTLTGFGLEDWDLWLNGLNQDSGLTLGYLNLPCFEYRVRTNSMLHRLFESKELQNKLMEILNSKYPGRVGQVLLIQSNICISWL